jgi:hypothetical protein
MAPSVHDLKCWPQFFEAVASGEKRFELRENDRNYRVGDTLLLHEWSPNGDGYSGRTVRARVTYVLHGGSFGLLRNHVCMFIELIGVTR